MITFIAAAVVLVLGVGAMFVFMLKKDGEFPKFDVGSNEQMRSMGIRCFKDEDAALHGVKCNGETSSACSECSLQEKNKK